MQISSMNNDRAVIWLAGGLALGATAWAGQIEPGPIRANAAETWSGKPLRFEIIKPEAWQIGPGSGRLDLRHLSLLTPAAKVQLPAAQRLKPSPSVAPAAEKVGRKAMAPANAKKAAVETKATTAKPVRFPVVPVESQTEK